MLGCRRNLFVLLKVETSCRIRHLSQLSAGIVLKQENLERCIQCIQKTPSIKMLWPKSEVEAAVLVPICLDDKGQISLLYTRRSGSLSRHVRQVSFPGGLKDSTDASYEDCALRETEEEIGLSRSRVKIIGTGSLLRPPRSAAIMPVFGIIEHFSTSELTLNQHEVDEAFTIPLEKLISPKCRFHTQFRDGYSTPAFLADGNKVWGLTGAITHNFLSCLLPDIYERKLPYLKPLKR